MRAVALAVAFFLGLGPAQAQTVVAAPAGRVEGIVEGGATVFRGIPYALPPVGALRWYAPRPAARWRGVRDARRFGNICTQPANTTDAGIGREPASEDCLTLNIWTPVRRAQGGRAPVMVWLHGGGYNSGSGSAPLYDGRQFAADGVVLVTLNYRLGRLGYFAHPELGEETNFGLLDQLAALRWVRRNIAAFGGDPDNVTLFGNSAGGESVLLLMLAPQARGLFARAIVQSGLGGRDLPVLAAAQSEGSAFAERLGARDLSALRAVPADRIVSADTPSIYRGFGPVIDGRTLHGTIAQGFAAGRQARVPLIIGYNGREVPPAAIGDADAAIRLVGHTPQQRAMWEAVYGSAEAYAAGVASDALFRGPAVNLALLHARSGAPTYLYAFDQAPAAVRTRFGGAPHASERAYVFGTLEHAPWPVAAEDRTLADDVGARWRAFARTGWPSVEGAIAWPTVSAIAAPMTFSGAHGGAGVPTPPDLLRLFRESAGSSPNTAGARP